MRFGWWPLCWIGRVGVAEEKEFDSGKPREEFGNPKKTPSKKSRIKATFSLEVVTSETQLRFRNDCLRGFNHFVNIFYT